MIGPAGGAGLRRLYISIILLVSLVIVSCGEESSNPENDKIDNGELQVRLVWQTQRAGITSRKAPPSGDVCVDFLITDIIIRVKDASGAVIAESLKLPCSDHKAQLNGIDARDGYKVEVEGLIGEQALWFGEKTDVAVTVGHTAEPITVAMAYIGDVSGPLSAEIFPENSASHIPTNTAVNIQFSKDVVAGSLNENSIRITQGDDLVSGTVVYHPNSFEAVFQPDPALSVSTTYVVTVTTDVMDRSGQNMAQEISSQFSTTPVWFVDAGNSNSGSGKTWADAFSKIAEAVAAAAGGDQIWVKQGTYTPTEQIILNKPVTLMGGFEGTENQHQQRRWKDLETVVDGNGRHRCFYISSNAAIDGFTITGGQNSGTNESLGGGIFIDAAAPQITNCAFADNSLSGAAVGKGGAIYISGGDPVIEKCAFTGNSAGNNSAHGGAIFNAGGGPMISGCIFTDNRTEGNDGGSGGAIENDQAKANAIIASCLFYANFSKSYMSSGGAIYNLDSDLTISGCRFVQNYSEGPYYGPSDGSGGAITNIRSDVHIQNSVFHANFVIGGAEYILGGAIVNDASSPTVTNCSFYLNRVEATGDGGHGQAVASTANSNAIITNTIIWGNSSDAGVMVYDDENSTSTVSYSNVDQKYLSGRHNIQINPRFGAGLHLRSDSPCINGADGDAAPAKDFDDEDRPEQDGVDMGADEFVDGDNNGLPDYWEVLHAVNSADGDADGDEVSNLGEYHLGTDPTTAQRVLNATLQGTVRYNDEPQTDGQTLVGRLDPGGTYHAYIVFDITDATQVVSAAVRLELTDYESSAVPVQIKICDVSATANDLISGTSGIFSDLGGGVYYSKFEPGPNDEGTVLDISLNQAAVEAIKAAGAGSGQFIIGLSLASEDPGHLKFSKASEDSLQQLILVEE